ncbi:MAG: transglutaminase [Spirochaetaceae bacterium]|nr:transglutaminase [Spirochaetaceae bacterium]
MFASLPPRGRALVPAAALIVLLAVLLLGSHSRAPVIEAADPAIGHGGDVLIVTGRGFGAARDGGQVLIAGVAPTSSAYLEWSAARISVRVPEEVRSGFVYVVAGGRRSNGVLFANRDHLPRVGAALADPGQPLVVDVSKRRAAVGDAVVITGRNFGSRRGSSAVLFTWLSAGPLAAGEGTAEFVAADAHDFDYENWSDTEIRVRVPDGAATGNLLVRTERGSSNQVFFEVGSAVGSKRYTGRRTYSVSMQLSITDVRASGPNDLYLWMPKVWQAPAQRNVRLVAREPEPLYEDIAGVAVFQLRNLVRGDVYDVTQQFIFERYAVQTDVDEGRVEPYDRATRAYRTFTSPEPLIAADDERVVALAERLTRGELNPWRRARQLYDGLLRRLVYDARRAADPVAALAAGSGDAYDFAMLYTALLRAATVPARPVAGYLVQSPDRLHAHYWTELYLHRFGWVPVDPALGSGAGLLPVDPGRDPAAYYFGNLDNRHLTLSKGVVETGKLVAHGRTVQRADLGTLQVHHEEVVGDLASYTARWSGLTILGVY